jgi:large subunit ribosomal protein L24
MNRKYNKIPKLHIRKGDTVKVISGDDKNRTGEVKKVNLKERTAIVDGVNMVTKHRKPDADNPNGSIVKIEAPIRVSKLTLMVNGEPTKVGRKRNEKGKLQRYAKSTGEYIKN